MSGQRALLLVGGAGFVGGYLAPALLQAFPDHRPVLLSRDTSSQPGWETVTADLLEPQSVDDIVGQVKPDIVVHLAAQSSVGAAARAAATTWQINFGGTLALASAVARYAPEGTFLFASTGEVYGRSFSALAATESTIPLPQNAYSWSKLAAEMMLRDVLPAQTRLIVTRAFNHTGPGQDERFVLPSFAAQIARIEAGLMAPVMQVGNLAAERDFLHVKDVVDAYVALLTRPAGDPRLVVNVASGRARRIEDLLNGLLSLSKAAIEVTIDPARMRPSEIPRAVGDARALEALTGWTPRHTGDQMLGELLDWWRGQVTA